MRKINLIVIHCSATPQDLDIGAAEIDQWHKEKGWDGIGYHYIIRRNGTIENGRPIEKIGAHAHGFNENSIGICLIGGTDADEKLKAEFNYTKEQMSKLDFLINKLNDEYPNCDICGHNDLTNAKTCPNFDVKAWYYGKR